MKKIDKYYIISLLILVMAWLNAFVGNTEEVMILCTVLICFVISNALEFIVGAILISRRGDE